MNIEQFAAELHAQQLARIRRDFPNINEPEEYVRVKVKRGLKYAKVDVGTSGKYMVVNATGEIYGIKGYGQIHRGHFYGTLDTVGEWDWSDYTAVKRRA